MTDIPFGEKLDRRILKSGFRRGHPLTALRLIEARRRIAAPFAYIGARAKARLFVERSPWAGYVPRDTGYRLFGPEALPGLADVVAAGRAIFGRHQEELSKDHNKRYFFNLMDREDLARHPALLGFALSRPMIEIAAGYLGQMPRLHSVGVFYSSVNNTVEGSQMFHVDGDCLTQLKCFVNIWPVEPGGGEFTFLTKPDTDERMRVEGLLKSMDDAAVAAGVPPERYVHVFGPAGAGVFVDTSRCLHQGSRSRTSPRLVFKVQYVSRPDSLLRVAGRKNVPGGHLHITRKLLEGLTVPNDADMLEVVE